MAEFKPSKKNAVDFNNNTQYRDYDPSTGQNGDAVQASTINNLVESQLWTQALATNAPDTSEANVVGTPSVEIATASDGTPKLKFKNLKGVTGSTGATGAAAGFGTPTASVDANVGTPQVTVTASGANTAKVFNFAFKNLKGDKGDTGATGAQGAKGDKGDTGTSVTVSSVSTSTADSGNNVVTFSDGSILNVKNGSKGSTGATGSKGDKGDTGATGAKGDTGVGISSIAYSSTYYKNDYSYTPVIFTKTDNTTDTVTIAVKNGETGLTGLQFNTIYQVDDNEDLFDEPPYIPLTYFNRQPLVDEEFIMFYSIKNEDNKVFATTFIVENASVVHNGVECALCNHYYGGDVPANYQITGNDGKGISKITDYYAVSTSSTTIPTSWSTTVPTMTSTNKYLWNYQYITYTDGDVYRSAERVIGAYGDTGEVDATKYVTTDATPVQQYIDGLKYFKRMTSFLDGIGIYSDGDYGPGVDFINQEGLGTVLRIPKSGNYENEVYLPTTDGTLATEEYVDGEITAIETALTNYPKLTSSNAYTGNNYFTNGIYVGAPATSATSAQNGVVNFYGNSATNVLQLTADAASISGVKNIKLPAENGTLATQSAVTRQLERSRDGWLPTTVYESEFSDIVFGDGVSRSGYIYATRETRGDKTRFTIDLTTTNAESISSSAIKMALLSTVGYKWRREYNLTALIVELAQIPSHIMGVLYNVLTHYSLKYMEVVEHSWKWTTTLSTSSVTNMLNGNGTTYAVPAYSARENSTLPAFWVWIEAVELDDYNTGSLAIDGTHIKVRLYA